MINSEHFESGEAIDCAICNYLLSTDNEIFKLMILFLPLFFGSLLVIISSCLFQSASYIALYCIFLCFVFV